MLQLQKGWPWAILAQGKMATLHQSLVIESAASTVALDWGLFDFLLLWFLATLVFASCEVGGIWWTGSGKIIRVKAIELPSGQRISLGHDGPHTGYPRSN